MTIRKLAVSEAKDPYTNQKELLRIYYEYKNNPDVVKYIASNKNAPMAIPLDILRRSEDDSQNPTGYIKVFRHLLKRKDLPAYIIMKLSYNRSASVRARAASLLTGGYANRLAEMYSDPDNRVREAVARNKSTPTPILMHARDSDPKQHVRIAAENTLSIMERM